MTALPLAIFIIFLSFTESPAVTVSLDDMEGGVLDRWLEIDYQYGGIQRGGDLQGVTSPQDGSQALNIHLPSGIDSNAAGVKAVRSFVFSDLLDTSTSSFSIFASGEGVGNYHESFIEIRMFLDDEQKAVTLFSVEQGGFDYARMYNWGYSNQWLQNGMVTEFLLADARKAGTTDQIGSVNFNRMEIALRTWACYPNAWASLTVDNMKLNSPDIPSPVPEPSTILLFCTGLGGIFLNKKKLKYKKSRLLVDISGKMN